MVFPGRRFRVDGDDPEHFMKIFQNRHYGKRNRVKRSGVGLFPLAHAEEQINDEPHEGHRGHQPPQGLAAGGPEIFLGHIEDGPDRADEKRDARRQKD